MELERKTLGRGEWNRMEKTRLRVEAVEESGFCGAVGLLYIEAVTRPLVVSTPTGVMCIADAGYRWLQFAPRGQHWWLTVLVDREDRLLESYFDITRENEFTEPQNPCFYDMKLDVTIAPGGQPRVLDEEELAEALKLGVIAPEEYALALDTARRIICWYGQHADEYYETLTRLYARLTEGRVLRV